MGSDLLSEKHIISQTLSVWSTCVIHLNRPMAWQRRPENIQEKSKIANFSDLVRQSLTSSHMEVRRAFFQNLSLVCEQLSQNSKLEPYWLIIHEIVDHLTTASDAEVALLSEEVYELLGDACLFQYYIERDMRHKGQDLAPVRHTYRDVMHALISTIKRHNSFVNNDSTEVMTQAKALESLLLTTADVFSFFNKGSSYEDVMGFLREQAVVEYIYYEVLFFVPGKT